MDQIAVLIPCYNEEKTIGKVILDFRRVLPEAVVYVYDNNSTDHSVELAKAAGAIVCHEYRQGKGNVIRRMFREVNAEVYIMVDGDDTYPAEAVVEMTRLVREKHADLVVGDRLSSTYAEENKRLFHNFGNNLVRSAINQLFHSQVKDILTGYRAFSYEFVKTYPVLSSGFEIETEMTIHAVDRKMQMETVVVGYRNRPKGSVSKLNTFSDGIRVLQTIVKLYRGYQPLRFFGYIAVFLGLVSIGFFIPVGMDYLHTGEVARFPTLIVCGLLMVIALLMFVAGVILASLREKDRQDFEFKLIQAAHMHDWLRRREKTSEC